MYSQIVTEDEYSEVRKFLPFTPVISIDLTFFAFQTHNLPLIKEETLAYIKHIWVCECWHCLEMRKRSQITGMDLYLRNVMLSNYRFTFVVLN